MKKIIVSKSRVHGTGLGEYRAFLEEDSTIFAYGDSENDAALQLIQKFPEVFKIQIESR